MSSYQVREKVRAELQTLGAIATFKETINSKPIIGAADPWMTAGFYVDYITQECVGGNTKAEHGTIDVDLFTTPGKTDQIAIQAADALIAHFEAWRSGSLEIESATGPQEFNTGDSEGLFYGVTVSLEYIYRT